MTTEFYLVIDSRLMSNLSMFCQFWKLYRNISNLREEIDSYIKKTQKIRAEDSE